MATCTCTCSHINSQEVPLDLGREILMENKMLSVRDVTNELRARGFSKMTERAVREEIKAKRLRAYKLREIYYISREDMEAYIKSGETMSVDDGEVTKVAC